MNLATQAVVIWLSGGWAMIAIQLPDAASLQRTKEVVAKINEGLAKVPGIGSKTAKKIILDLKDKVQAPGDLVLEPEGLVELAIEDEEVLGALTMLGYSVVEAQTALQHVPANVKGVEERLRAALAYFG